MQLESVNITYSSLLAIVSHDGLPSGPNSSVESCLRPTQIQETG